MINKKVIVCDLDGTLAPSKSPISDEMREVLLQLLNKYKVAVVSGGGYAQFQKQFLSQLQSRTELFKNLYIFPTMGSTCYLFNTESNSWEQLYEEVLSEDERLQIKKSLSEAILESGLDLSNSFGELVVEDRGTQVTFSGRGQIAPLEEKVKWDKDQSKRRMLVLICCWRTAPMIKSIVSSNQ